MYISYNMNLGHFLRDHDVDLNIVQILSAIDKSGIEIEHLVNRVALDNNTGVFHGGVQNSSGDEQKKLDVLTNDIMIENLTQSGACSLLLSEENDHAIVVDDSHSGNYIVAFDPLDGSSNIDCNCGVGTIFSITLDINKADSIDHRVLQNGNNILCAGYILYGGSTDMVISLKGLGAHRFTLDTKTCEYIHTGILDITTKHKKIYSVNESNCERWGADIKTYIEQYRTKSTKYTQRWVGSMVSDIHRTLLYGGMFCYPWDEQNVHGKLRILYECFPMAMILEEAGGMAIVAKMGMDRILDIIPSNIHQRTPVLLGSKEEIVKYEQIVAQLHASESSI